MIYTILIVIIVVSLVPILVKEIRTRRRLYQRALYLSSEYPHAFDKEFGTVDFIFKTNNNITLRVLLEDYSTEPRLKRIEQDIMEKLRKEEEERKETQRKFESIKSSYPAGVEVFEKYHKSHSIDSVIQNEDLIKQYEEYHVLISNHLMWRTSQESFISSSNTQHEMLIAGWVTDLVTVNLPSINDRGDKEPLPFEIPCHYFYQFCRDNSLDYSYDPLAGTYANDIVKIENKKATFKDTLYDPLVPFIESLPGPSAIVFSDSEQGSSARSFNTLHFKHIRSLLDNKQIPFCELSDSASFLGKGIKSFVVLEVLASAEDIKESCRYVLNLLKSDRPCITHISVLREIPKEQMINRLDRLKKEADERENHRRETERRRQQEERERQERERREAEEEKIRKEKNRLAALSSNSKAEASSIQNYLRRNCVNYFYHFTDRRNLASIKKHGGLFSWKYCEDHNIAIPYTGGSDFSRSLDRSHGLSDYVRLSFCDDHPMAFRLKQNNYDLVLLKIKVDVASIDTTLFSDMNATDSNHHHGGSLSDLQRVDISATRANYLNSSDPRFKQHQAEVLVKTFVPLKYIVNIDDPEDMR